MASKMETIGGEVSIYDPPKEMVKFKEAQKKQAASVERDKKGRFKKKEK